MVNYFNWINKRLADLVSENEFSFFFTGIDLIKIENSFYLTNKSKGIELVLSIDKTITSVHFFSKIERSYSCFSLILPKELEFSDSRLIVQSKLGKPNRSGGGVNDLYLGYIHAWDKYYFQEYSLHLEYSENNDTIRIITIGSLELESYFDIELQ